MRPRQIGDQLGEGTAALSDRCELMFVTDKHHLRSGSGGRVQQHPQVLSADHARLVDDDQSVTVEDLGTALELTQQRIESVATIPGLLTHRDVDRTPGRSDHQNAFPGRIRGAAQCPQRVSFAGPAGALRGCASRSEVAMAVMARA